MTAAPCNATYTIYLRDPVSDELLPAYRVRAISEDNARLALSIVTRDREGELRFGSRIVAIAGRRARRAALARGGA